MMSKYCSCYNCRDVISYPSKRKTTSSLWHEFEKVKEEDGTIKATWKHCNKHILGAIPHRVSHLEKHSERCPKPAQEFRPKTISSSYKETRRGASSSGTSHLQNHLQRCTRRMHVTLHNYPFTIVQHTRFRNFVKNLQPLFKMVSRFTSEKKRLHMELEKIPSRVSLTTDMWSSYESWKLKKRILSFLYVPSPHTGDVIAIVPLDLLMHWKLEKKLVTVTLHNAAYNDVTTSSLKRQLSRNSSLVLEGKMFHVRCCAYKTIGVVVQKIREGIKFIKASQARQERFNGTISLLQIESKKNIWLDKKHFIGFAQDEFSSNLVSCDSEWETTKEIYDCLKVFFYVTLCGMMSSKEHISFMAIQMKDKFDKYWKICSLILAVAVVVDPRYKLQVVQYYYSKINGRYAEHQEPAFPFDENFNILKWWELNAPKFANLSKMARDVLVILVSTVALESSFSTVGRILAEYRSSLKPETVQALMCAQDWLHNDVEDRK
ncbi:hypothetical protein AMTRI_Chr07g29800 [Amborella trichopoda]